MMLRMGIATAVSSEILCVSAMRMLVLYGVFLYSRQSSF
jgi:hypothetical protein